MTSGFRITLFAIISAASAAASGPVAAGDTLRCGSRIVSIDMIAAAVRAICGEPAYRDYWPSPDRRYWPGAEDTETWTYNFGPNQLLRILRFRGQRLRSIETDGYGFNGDGAHLCEPNEIVSGISKYRLLARCGDPVATRAIGYVAGEFDDHWGQRTILPAYREEWTYNFGTRYLLREVILENGRVSRVFDGDRGFPR